MGGQGKGLKIAFIGAGSAVWGSRILVDILLKESLRGSKIYLMDISGRRLDLVYGFAKRYAEELGASMEIYKTKDRVEALREADFVISAALASPYQTPEFLEDLRFTPHYYYDLLIEAAEQKGYYRGVNPTEWNFVTNYFNIIGYHQFKYFVELLEDIEEHAPEAWLLTVSNPVLELTTLAHRVSKVKNIGLCHGGYGFFRLIRELGLDRSKVDRWETVGLNHVVFLTAFEYDGRNGYEYIDGWISGQAEKYWRVWRLTTDDPYDIDLAPAAIDMYRTYGLFPIGDTVRGGTWKYHLNLEAKMRWYGPYGGPDSEIGWKWRNARGARELKQLEEVVNNPHVKLTHIFPPKPSGEELVDIIESIATDTPRMFRGVNVPNNGAISGIPDSIAVEAPVTIDGKGVHRVNVTQPNSKIVYYVLYPRVVRAEMSIDANLKGGRDRLLEWLMYDVRTKSERQANEAIDAMLSIPGNEEMAKHFS